MIEQTQAIAFAVAETPMAQHAAQRLAALYPSVPESEADVIIALGGDGLVLETLHRCLALKTPVYGMNCGAIGFLTNKFDEADLLNRLAHARPAKLHPLNMRVFNDDHHIIEAHALNEVALTRANRQAGKIRILVDGQIRMPELIADGILLSTPLGSTAYNLSAHGPILPLSSELLALTPISAFRPRRWRGALLPHTARLCFEVLEADKRPMAAVADYTEVRHVNRVEIVEDRQVAFTLLFDPGEDLDERILKEQFAL